MGEFSSGIDRWVAQSRVRTRAVIQESTKLVMRQAQAGNPHIPVDTGFARASIRASLSNMPQIDHSSTGHAGVQYTFDLSEPMLVVNQFQLGQTIYIGYTAAYVIYLEYGHSQQAPQGFVRIAAAMWSTFVSQAVAKLKSQNNV